MKSDEETVTRDGAEMNGSTEEPRASDSTNPDAREKDNLHTGEQENSANGLDGQDVRGGQDGRNIRGLGSTDMDSQNGVLRMGDQDNSTMEVTEEGMASAAGEAKTSTSTVSVTTAGPDDYASDPEVSVPNAQEEAKKQDDEADTASSTSADGAEANTAEEDEDIAETGTSINHQPTY